MIFYITYDLKTPEGVKQKNILLGGSFTIGGQKLDVHAFSLIQNKEVRGLVHDVCDFKIGKIKEFTTPVITVEQNVIQYLGMTGVTSVYTKLIKIFNDNFGLNQALAKNDMEAFKEIVNTAKKQLAASALAKSFGEYFNFFIDTVFGFYRYTHYCTLKDFDNLSNNIIDADCFAETQDFINSFKKIIIIGDNKTLKQNAYNNEFFINIPSYYTLSNDELDDMGTLIPDLINDVCKPYTEKIAYTPDYKQVKYTPIKLIEGQSSNNGNLIYEYNERYYKSLLAQIKENIKTYYEDAGNNIQILDQNGDVKNTAIIDPFSQDYLLELCKRLYSLHWSHNRAVPCSIAIDNVSEDSDITSAESKYEFYLDERQGSGYINALVLLENFLKSVSTKCGYKVYVDAVLQLSRWGLDKPTALVFDNYDKVFVLGTNEVRSKAIDLSTCVIAKHDGCDNYVAEYIVLDKEITDKSVESLPALAKNFTKRITVPVGIGIATDYVPEALAKSQSFSKDDVTTNYKYYSFIDFVKLIENDKDFVENLSGVTYDGTSINLAKLDHVETITSILEKLHNSSMLESYNPFFRSEELTGIYMEIGAKMDSELPPSILTILNSKFDSPSLAMGFKTISFSSKEELLEKKRTYQIVGSLQNAIDVCILKEVLPIFFEVNATNNAGNVDNIANVYKEVIDKNFVSEIAFYQSANQNNDLAKNTASDAEVRKMDSFSTVKDKVKPTTSNNAAEPVKSVKEESKEVEKVNSETTSRTAESQVTSKATEPQTTSRTTEPQATPDVKIIRAFTNKENAHYSPKLLIDKNNKPFAALIVEQDDNIKSFTVFTLAEFIKIFGENEYHNLSKAIRLKKIVEKFVKQCIYTGSLENYDDCVYFNSLKAYVNFANVLVSFL